MQPAGGVDEHEVGARGSSPRPSRRTRPSPGRRRPGRGRSRRRCARPTARAGRRPRRGTCRPRRARRACPSATCCEASLPIVVVFPTPLTPTNIHTFGLARDGVRASRSRVSSRMPDTSSRTRPSSASASVTSSTLARSRTALEEPLRRRHADVGEEHRLFELVPGVVVDLAPADRAQVAGERGAGPAEPVAQPRLDDLFGLDDDIGLVDDDDVVDDDLVDRRGPAARRRRRPAAVRARSSRRRAPRLAGDVPVFELRVPPRHRGSR